MDGSGARQRGVNPVLFEKYSQMGRSRLGLAGAPEDMMDIPGMKDERRQPMMLWVAAHKG